MNYRMKLIRKEIVLILSIVSFVTATGFAQPLLRERMQYYPLLPYQSFVLDTAGKELILVSLANPEALQKRDSLFQEAQLLAYSLRRDVIYTDWQKIAMVKVIYMNRYCYDVEQGLIFQFDVTEGRKTGLRLYEPLPGLDHAQVGVPKNDDSLRQIDFFKRAYGYPLGPDEFFVKLDYREGKVLEFFKNVDMEELATKTDSLQEASLAISRRLYLDIIRLDCGEFIRVSVTYQDRHFPRKQLAWSYKIVGCWFDEDPVVVGR